MVLATTTYPILPVAVGPRMTHLPIVHVRSRRHVGQLFPKVRACPFEHLIVILMKMMMIIVVMMISPGNLVILVAIGDLILPLG